MFFTKSNGIMTAALMLSLGATAGAFAQQIPDSAGIVRISDSRPGSGAPQAGGPQIEQTSAFRSHAMGGPYAGGCPTGNCPTGNCPTGNQYGNYQAAGGCPTGQCPHGRGCFRGCFGECYCKHSPDYGYSPPSKYPLLRRGVEYNNYYPANWYGAGADYSQSQAPMVYQPTDTTQLGYYYQHVPFWQPQPNQLPARPIPAQWNITPPAVQASRWCGNSANCQSGYRGFHFHNGGLRYYHANGRRFDGGGYGMTGSYPIDATMCPQGTSPQPINSGVTAPSGQPIPTPVETNVPASPGALPPESESPEQGAEPNALPPTTAVPPSPNGTGIPATPPLPTTSATSGHIRRIGLSN